ncbi:MAG: hypothetical protein ACQEVA_19635 [Myxococcota bacterium]
MHSYYELRERPTIMQEFLQIALSFPTAIFSGLLIVIVLYWLFVIVGMVDIDLFDLDVDLDLDGDFGDVDVDADVGDLDVDADVDADVDGDMDVDADTSGGSFWVSVASALGLGTVPITIIASVLVLSTWVLSFMSTYYLGDILGTGIVVSVGYTLASFLVSLPITSLVVSPLKDLFRHEKITAGHSVIGRVCQITSGRVDEDFGQAKLDDGAAGLLLSVRTDSDEELSRGSKALIIGYDQENNTYEVECYEQFEDEQSDDVEFDFDALEAEEQEKARKEKQSH